MGTPGRPSDYSEAICDRLIVGLLEGLSMRQICAQEGMPHRMTIIRWLGEHEEFASKYARAREMQADLMDDKILETAEACTPKTARADRVKIAAFQWRASKLRPKVYGERITQEHSGPDGGPIAVERIVREIVDPAK